MFFINDQNGNNGDNDNDDNDDDDDDDVCDDSHDTMMTMVTRRKTKRMCWAFFSSSWAASTCPLSTGNTTVTSKLPGIIEPCYLVNWLGEKKEMKRGICLYRFCLCVVIQVELHPLSFLTCYNKSSIANVYQNDQKNDQKKIFYDHLRAKICTLENKFIAGDFNDEIGKLKEGGIYTCLSKFSKGRRNNNGQWTMNYVKRLFVSNGAFNHPARYWTTWVGQIKDT